MAALHRSQELTTQREDSARSLSDKCQWTWRDTKHRAMNVTTAFVNSSGSRAKVAPALIIIRLGIVNSLKWQVS